MRLSRLSAFVPAVLFAVSAVRADDTEDFLKPENWEGRSDIWTIEKGKIVGETKEDPKYNTFFCSKEKYGDFELSFTVLLKDGVGNSGVQVRSKLNDAKKFTVSGPQVDIGSGYWGSLYGEGVGGMIKASDPKLIKMHVKEQEANTYKIVAKGSKTTIVVNGETFIDDDFPKLPGKDGKDYPAEGIIAFQAHAGYKAMKVEFTDIKFKKLK